MLRNRLKTFRHKHEMTQTQFAELLRVDRQAYNRWELQRRQPALDQAIRISEKIGCTVNELFYFDDKEHNKT